MFVTRKSTQGLHGLKSMLSVPPRIKAITDTVTYAMNVSLILPGSYLEKEDLQFFSHNLMFGRGDCS